MKYTICSNKNILMAEIYLYRILFVFLCIVSTYTLYENIYIGLATLILSLFFVNKKIDNFDIAFQIYHETIFNELLTISAVRYVLINTTCWYATYEFENVKGRMNVLYTSYYNIRDPESIFHVYGTVLVGSRDRFILTMDGC